MNYTEVTVSTTTQGSELISDLQAEIETLARLHIQHGLYDTEGFQKQKENIETYVQEHKIDLRRELDPLAWNLYRRYFG